MHKGVYPAGFIHCRVGVHPLEGGVHPLEGMHSQEGATTRGWGGTGSKNVGILFRFPHLFLYFNSCRRFSVTIMAVMQILVPAHIMQILMVAENLLLPSNGYRKPSATVKIRKQMRKPKQYQRFFTHEVGWGASRSNASRGEGYIHWVHPPVSSGGGERLHPGYSLPV